MNNPISRNQLGYRKPLSETFWAKVTKTKTCWLWNNSSSNHRYGTTMKRGLDGSKIGMGAHRRSWEIHYGEIPEGIHVLHKCDTKRCVNPDHLFLGTQKDNMVDKVQKKRQALGEKNGWAKMTSEKVLEMRRLYADGMKRKELALLFEMSQSGTKDICLRRRWKHI